MSLRTAGGDTLEIDTPRCVQVAVAVADARHSVHAARCHRSLRCYMIRIFTACANSYSAMLQWRMGLGNATRLCAPNVSRGRTQCCLSRELSNV